MLTPNIQTGQTFGTLRVVPGNNYSPQGDPLVRLVCTCGRTRQTKPANLTSGRVRACYDCARLPAFTLATSIRHYTAADFKREWRKWLAEFTRKQNQALHAKLRDWADGYTVRHIPDEVRAGLVAEVMTTWLARTLAAMNERGVQA